MVATTKDSTGKQSIDLDALLLQLESLKATVAIEVMQVLEALEETQRLVVVVMLVRIPWCPVELESIKN